MKENDLTLRLLNFSISVIKVLRKLPNDTEYKAIKHQLIRSSSSTGANYEEAQGASSKPDFNNKVHIALKEIRESNYWLKIISGINKDKKLEMTVGRLIQESEELKKILGSISSKSGKSLNK